MGYIYYNLPLGGVKNLNPLTRGSFRARLAQGRQWFHVLVINGDLTRDVWFPFARVGGEVCCQPLVRLASCTGVFVEDKGPVPDSLRDAVAASQGCEALRAGLAIVIP